MNLNNRFTRFAVAMGAVGMISSQIPMAGGVAFADDPYPTGGGGGSRGAVQAVVLGLVGIGLYSTLSDRGGNTPPPPPGPIDATGGGSGVNPIGGCWQQPPPVRTRPIWDTAAGNDDLTSFADSAKAADLQDKLRDAGPYTAFIPTNAAFAAIPADTMTELRKPENKSKLQALLTYHVVINKKYTIAELKAMTDGIKLATANGGSVTITNTGGVLKVDNATVVESDIPASNGIIHPISSVLAPPAPAE